MAVVYVFLGGGTGAVLRWAIGLMLPSPFAVLAVNVLGSALLAVILHPHTALDPDWRLALGTGMMGGLTTYSSYNQELVDAIVTGQPGRAVGIVAATVVACLGAGLAGWWLAGTLQPAP